MKSGHNSKLSFHVRLTKLFHRLLKLKIPWKTKVPWDSLIYDI